MSGSWTDFSHALVRDLPSSFAQHALIMAPKEQPIDMARAQAEHKAYEKMLQALVPQLIHVPADESCPDSCFVEDALLVVPPFRAAPSLPPASTAQQGQEQQEQQGQPQGEPLAPGAQPPAFQGLAIVTRPGAPSRQPEVKPIAKVLKDIGYPTHRIKRLEAPATLDGGDVMFTGAELWVGLSHRTNAAAVDQLRALLMPACPVFAFKMPESGALHLKSVVAALDDATLVVADNATAQAIRAQAASEPRLQRFSWVSVPDALCSNVLRLGSTVVMQHGFPNSHAVLAPVCERKGLRLITAEMGETAKADGALTCCSVLLTVPKPPPT